MNRSPETATLTTRSQVNSNGTTNIPNEVSWQSAFWALIPIALNSMTQPSGEIAGLTSKYSFALRSSPIICAVDAAMALFTFVRLSIRLRSPRAASQRILAYRFRNHLAGSTGGLEDLQSNTIFRIVLFVLGALPQMIKLCGVQGLVWTRVWAAMFLVSFMVLEILVLIVPQNAPSRVDQVNRNDGGAVNFYLGFNALYASLIFSHVVGILAISRHLGSGRVYLIDNYGILVQAIIIATFPIRRTDHFVHPMIEAALMVVLEERLAAVGDVNMPVWVTVMISLGGIATMACLTSRYPYSETGECVGADVAAYLVFMNLLSTLLFYALRYDPRGTIKPAWTEQLG